MNEERKPMTYGEEAIKAAREVANAPHVVPGIATTLDNVAKSAEEWRDAAIAMYHDANKANSFLAAEIGARVKCEERIADLERQVRALESLRPVWAQGFTSDSIAAQSNGASLAQIWQALGVENQTEAMRALNERSEIKPTEYPLRWWFGSSEEAFSEQFDTREEAVAYAKEYGGGYITQARHQDFCVRIDGDWLIEHLQDRNEERLNEDGDFIEADKDQLKKLEHEVEQTILRWARDNNISLRAWAFADDMTTPERIAGDEA